MFVCLLDMLEQDGAMYETSVKVELRLSFVMLEDAYIFAMRCYCTFYVLRNML